MHFKKFGKYTIIKKLASGGMADILLASDLSPTGFGRFVVIKRALSKFSENEEFKDMFKNEGKVACNLKHRNITPIYEFGIERNQFFLSMEYISGKNLREFIKKSHGYRNPINISNTVHIIKEVASGLNYAHNAIDSNTGQPLNLIHRDISPQNIMLSFDGEIKLIDFGIAKIADTNLTRAGHLKGKFSYMSPEQAHGEVLDERTDIFCLGIILWELLTNKRLFASKNELTSLKKVKNCDIFSAQKINPKIPTELNNIVKKALSKNKNSRYETAAKLEQDLNRFLNKTYPEYSHYDFISLMKTTYRKEIMGERENLKTYFSEFKKYLNALNIEESLKTQVDLNIPDLSTLVEIKPKQRGESTGFSAKNEADLTNNSPSLSSDYASYFSTVTKEASQSLNPASQAIKDNSTTLVQKKTIDTQTGHNITKTQERSTQTNRVEQFPTANTEKVPKANDNSLALGLQDDTQFVTNQTDFLKSMQNKNLTQSTKKTAALYDEKAILMDDHDADKISRGKKIITLFLTLIMVLSFSVAVYWVIKTDRDMIGFIQDNILKKTIPSQPLEPNGESLRPIQETALGDKRFPSSESSKDAVTKRRIFITSKPSGAAIFINNQFSSKYTPSLVELTLIKSSSITLKKEGYLSKSFRLDPKKQTNNSVSIDLTVDHLSQSPETIIIQ